MKLPFQTKYSQIPLDGMLIPSLEVAKAAFPIFGGTSPTTDSGSSSDSDKDKETTPTSDSNSDGSKTSAAGGESTDPAALTPEQITGLLKQVENITSANADLEKKLKGFTDKEEETRKAAMGREEALTEDLNKAHATIAAMDEVIKYVALVSAITSDPDTQFHDIDFVMSKLDENGYEFNLDLENKKANIKGIGNELKRIAKENEWAVKNMAADQSNNGGDKRGPGRPRGSGAPPANPNLNAGKSKSRSELIDRFPVLAAGRSGIRK